MRTSPICCGAFAAIVFAALAPVPAQALDLRHNAVVGGGYAAFEFDGAPGDNSYWVYALGRGRAAFGQWYADVFIDFGGFQFDFEALYQVTCVEIDRHTREAWIDGRVIQSNDPDNIGIRATLYLQDGGEGGTDYHAITPLADGVDCRSRPEPDFREEVQSGNYFVR